MVVGVTTALNSSAEDSTFGWKNGANNSGGGWKNNGGGSSWNQGQDSDWNQSRMAKDSCSNDLAGGWNKGTSANIDAACGQANSWKSSNSSGGDWNSKKKFKV